MGLTVSLGLGRFLAGAPPDAALPLLEKLVADGYTTCVREVLGAPDDGGARVVEVALQKRRPVTRVLDGTAAQELLDELRALQAARASSVSFSWEDLEDVGADNVQDLALVLDGQTALPRLTRIALAPEVRVRLIDVADAALNWQAPRPDVDIAANLHGLAAKHRLIVHSA